MTNDYHNAVRQMAHGDLIPDDPVLASRVDNIRDWCARINLRKTPEQIIHDTLSNEVSAWLLTTKL